MAFLYATPARSPFRSRLHFQINAPADDRSLAELAKTAQWLKESNRSPLVQCLLVDDITGFALSAYFGLPTNLSRTMWNSPIREIENEKSLERYLREHNICGVMVIQPNKVPQELSSSWIATFSGHWSDEIPNLILASGSFPDLVSRIDWESKGWKELNVPPFYTLYLKELN